MIMFMGMDHVVRELEVDDTEVIQQWAIFRTCRGDNYGECIGICDSLLEARQFQQAAKLKSMIIRITFKKLGDQPGLSPTTNKHNMRRRNGRPVGKPGHRNYHKGRQ